MYSAMQTLRQRNLLIYAQCFQQAATADKMLGGKNIIIIIWIHITKDNQMT